ncbi:MAG: hypothetical protein ABF289_19480 [Clostridiales bacterium]
MVKLQKTDVIKTIKDKLFDDVKGFMRNKRDTPEDQLFYLNDNEKNYYKNYSYRYLLKGYIPHITLFRDEKLDIQSFLKELNNEFKRLFELKTNIERLTVYKMGKNSTHEKH